MSLFFKSLNFKFRLIIKWYFQINIHFLYFQSHQTTVKYWLFNSLFFTFSLIGSFFVLDKPLKEEDSSSFFALTGGYGEDGGGFCRGTPTEYGVTVFKMGFCTKNSGNPTGSSILEGSKPN